MSHIFFLSLILCSNILILFIFIISIIYYYFLFSDYNQVWLHSQILTIKHTIYKNTNLTSIYDGYNEDNMQLYYYLDYFNLKEKINISNHNIIEIDSFSEKTKYIINQHDNHTLKNSNNVTNNDNYYQDNAAPRYVTKENFLLDIDELNKYFYTKNKTVLSSIYDYIYNNEDSDYGDSYRDINTEQRLLNKMLGLIFNLTKNTYRKYRLNKLIKYIDKKLKEEEKNNNNVIKGFNGFEDLQNLKKFYEIDFNLYKIILDYSFVQCSIYLGIIILFLVIYYIYIIIDFLKTSKYEKSNKKYYFLILYIVLYYSIFTYLKQYKIYINHSSKNDINIKCDKYIKNILNELSKTFNYNYMFVIVFRFSFIVSVILQILAWIISFYI